MPEHSVPLLRDRQECQVRRERGAFGHFDSAHVVEVSCAIEVEADAVRCPAHLSWDLAQMRREPLPLRGDAFDMPVAVARGQAREEECFAIFETRRFETWRDCRVHVPMLAEKDARLALPRGVRCGIL